jgi:hypothetical protein
MSKSKHNSPPKMFAKKSHSSIINWNYVIIVLAIAVFIFTCLKLDLTQDDAYITFRYAANFLSGHGLVFNTGERVEGYTNFLWVMLMALFKGVFGIEFLTFSKVVGVITGSAIFFLLYLLLKHHFEKVPIPLHISLAVVLLGNLSIPYWSIAGLETSAFTCMVLAAVIAEYRRPQLSPALLVIASLLRPEGVIVFGVILLNRFIVIRKIPWQYILFYVIPLLPFAVFKLTYYGSLFPNPYYAKSGVGLEYIQSGLEYLWYFARTIGVYGIIFVVPLIAIRKLWCKYSLLYLYILIYTLYIIWVGGDVLRVYRFFVPVVPMLSFLFVVSLTELIFMVVHNRRQIYRIVLVCAGGISYLMYSFSQEYVWTSRNQEIGLTNKMAFISTKLKQYMGKDFSLAVSTIGRIGYDLLGHRVIDMVGLTDAYIAHHPEELKGITSTWKERRFNNRYLLEQQPDFILFSTDYKPSAPAERVLMLHSEFRKKYTLIGFFSRNGLRVIWRRIEPLDMSKDVVCSDIEFVNKIYEGCTYFGRNPHEALISLHHARQKLGEEYALITLLSGLSYQQLNMIDSARVSFNQTLRLDSLSWMARVGLLEIAQRNRDGAAASYQMKFLQQQCPWIFESN